MHWLPPAQLPAGQLTVTGSEVPSALMPAGVEVTL